MLKPEIPSTGVTTCQNHLFYISPQNNTLIGFNFSKITHKNALNYIKCPPPMALQLDGVQDLASTSTAVYYSKTDHIGSFEIDGDKMGLGDEIKTVFGNLQFENNGALLISKARVILSGFEKKDARNYILIYNHNLEFISEEPFYISKQRNLTSV